MRYSVVVGYLFYDVNCIVNAVWEKWFLLHLSCRLDFGWGYFGGLLSNGLLTLNIINMMVWPNSGLGILNLLWDYWTQNKPKLQMFIVFNYFFNSIIYLVVQTTHILIKTESSYAIQLTKYVGYYKE